MTTEATSQWRQDALTGRWVIIAPDRAARTQPRRRRPPDDDVDVCPLCRLAGDANDDYIARSRGPDGPITVVANRYPCVQAVPGHFERSPAGPYDRAPGLGAHEVVIETPIHDHDLCDMDALQLTALLKVWQQRILDLHRDTRLRAFYVFRNFGRGSGATLRHPHSQLVATPIVPHQSVTEFKRAYDHFREHKRPLLDALIAHEIADGRRIVRSDAQMVTLCPFAPRVDFETWIVGTSGACFHHLSDDPLGRLAEHLRDVLIRLKASLPELDYNLVLKTAPNLHVTPQPDMPMLANLPDWWRWRLEILPRLHRAAGLEWSSGTHVATVTPEQAADHLRRLVLRTP